MRAMLSRVVLVLFLAWPGAAFVLHRLAGVDPWRLFSFAMYSTMPRLGPAWGVGVFVPAPPGFVGSTTDIDGRAFVELVPGGALAEETIAYLERRRTLGSLTSSRTLARVVRQQLGVECVVIVTSVLELGEDSRLHRQTFQDVWDCTR